MQGTLPEIDAAEWVDQLIRLVKMADVSMAVILGAAAVYFVWPRVAEGIAAIIRALKGQ